MVVANNTQAFGAAVDFYLEGGGKRRNVTCSRTYFSISLESEPPLALVLGQCQCGIEGLYPGSEHSGSPWRLNLSPRH